MAVTIESRQREWMQAWMDKDEANFNDILAGDFLLSSARGVWMKKSQWIEGAIGLLLALILMERNKSAGV